MAQHCGHRSSRKSKKASTPGYAFSQVLRLFSIFSMICGHSAVPFMLFPTLAPRYLVVSPSLCILISSGMGVVGSVESEQVSRTCCLCSALPAGIMTVLSLLNFAPEARHHLSRSLKSDLVLSLSVRKTAALSANRDSLTASLLFGVSILRPWICVVLHSSLD